MVQEKPLGNQLSTNSLWENDRWTVFRCNSWSKDEQETSISFMVRYFIPNLKLAGAESSWTGAPILQISASVTAFLSTCNYSYRKVKISCMHLPLIESWIIKSTLASSNTWIQIPNILIYFIIYAWLAKRNIDILARNVCTSHFTWYSQLVFFLKKKQPNIPYILTRLFSLATAMLSLISKGK